MKKVTSELVNSQCDRIIGQLESDIIERAKDKDKKVIETILLRLKQEGPLTRLGSILDMAGLVGLRVSLVLHDVKDSPPNQSSIDGHTFKKCWEELGKPHFFFERKDYDDMREMRK